MITPIIMRDFLQYYGYDEATEEGCEIIYDLWKEQKAKLLEKFRKHPNWDEDNLAIVFKEEQYERGFDKEAFTPFIGWVYSEAGKLGYTDESHAFQALEYIRHNCNSQFVSAEEAERIKDICPSVKVNEGLKLTKAIQKLCIIIGVQNVKDIRPAHDNTDRMKDFGFNYQFQLLADRINPTTYKRITVISLNPLDYWGMSFGYKWASCHTIDKWNKRNMNGDSHHYSGCYSAGTESYMLDTSSIIFYVVREDYEGNCYWEEDKMNRVVFCVNENASMILESRVYPDGRDGGDESLAKQFRNVMQKVICDTYDLNNYWTVKKGTSACCERTITDGPHYKDYQHYSDCNVSVNNDECMDFPKIRIGHNAVCPGCGETHYGEKNIMCYDCGGEENDEDIRWCERCSERINIDRDDYEYAGDEYYCCRECAEANGYRLCYDNDEWYYKDDLYLCEDDGEYHNEYHCYRDYYDDCYYSGNPEIMTCDGYTYASEENAEADGYAREYFSEEWKRTDRLSYDEYENEWFDTDNENCILTEDGKYYATEDSAEHAGYVETTNYAWIKEEDAIEVDGNYYESEEDLETSGYVKNKDDKWVLSEVA